MNIQDYHVVSCFYLLLSGIKDNVLWDLLPVVPPIKSQIFMIMDISILVQINIFDG